MIKNTKFRIFLTVLMLIISVASFIGCSKNDDKNNAQTHKNNKKEESVNKKDKKITFVDAGWDTIRLHNNIASFIIENGYGYTTDTVSGSMDMTFQGLQQGDIDVHMELWKYGYEPTSKAIVDGEIVELGVNVDDSKQGIYVPTYVIKGDKKRGIEPMAPELKTVKDLEKYWELFKDPEDNSKGRIYSAPTGWRADAVTRDKIKTYGLDKMYNVFNPGSEAGLTTSIAEAVEKGHAWAGYEYEPSWVLGKYDMTLLEDEPYNKEKYKTGACEFPPESIIIATKKGFSEKAPEVLEFLSKYKTSSALVSEVMAYMNDNNASVEDGAKYFLKDHEDIWTKWVSEEIAQKVREQLK